MQKLYDYILERGTIHGICLTGLRVLGCAAQVEPTVQKLYDYILERGTIHGI